MGALDSGGSRRIHRGFSTPFLGPTQKLGGFDWLDAEGSSKAQRFGVHSTSSTLMNVKDQSTIN